MFSHSHYSRYRARLVALLLLMAAVGAASQPSFSSSRRWKEPELGPLEQEMLWAINDIRSRAGMAPLQFESRSMDMAQEQALDMAERGYFDHTRPGFPDRRAESFGERVDRFGFLGTVGENLSNTGGYEPQQSLRAAIDGWMRSPGHRANILNPGYRFTGIAHYRWAQRTTSRRGSRIQWRDNWVQTFFSPPVTPGD